MARMYRMPRRLSICNNLVLICTILAIVRGKWIHTDLRFSLFLGLTAWLGRLRVGTLPVDEESQDFKVKQHRIDKSC